MFLIVSWISKEILMKKRRWKVKKIRAQLWFEMQLLLMRARAKKKRTHNNWTLQPPQRTASFFSQSVLFDVYFCDLNNSVKGQHTKTSYLRHHHHHQHRQNAKCVQQSASIGTCAVVDNIKLHLIHVDITFSKWQTATTKPKIYQEIKSTSNQNRTIAWIAEEGMGQKRDLVCIVKGII